MLAKTRLTMPVLSSAESKVWDAGPAKKLGFRRDCVILKDTGHWLMEERPKETMDALIVDGLQLPAAASGVARLAPLPGISMPGACAPASTSGCGFRERSESMFSSLIVSESRRFLGVQPGS